MSEQGATFAEEDRILRDRLWSGTNEVDDANWQDVETRAGVLASANKRRRRVLALTGAALAVCAIAAPALGFATGLLPFFNGEPAPPSVQASFERLSREVLPQDARVRNLILSQAHGVVASTTRYGAVRLWVAPTESGDLCRLIQIDREPIEDHAFNCGPKVLSRRTPIELGIETLARTPGVTLIDGRANPSVVSVGIALKDGSVVQLPIVDSFFLGAIEEGPAPDSVVVTYLLDGKKVESRIPLPQ